MKKLLFCLLCSLFLFGCKNEEKKVTIEDNPGRSNDPLTTQIAFANGFKNFEDVKQLNFTFNVKVNDSLRTERAWKWFPQEDKIELTEKGETSTYINDGDLNEAEKTIDQKFINDIYWFLFPYQLIWSEYESEHNRSAQAPISKETMQQLTVKFAGDGGYTPGDSYHLYFNDDMMIREWTYESSGGRTLSTTWEDYETFEGITVSKTHKSEDGSFELFFTNIEVIK